jgi:hypothetical protein
MSRYTVDAEHAHGHDAHRQEATPQTPDLTDDASSRRDDARSLTEYSDGVPLLLPSKDGTEPGFAPTDALSRGLQVPSKSARLSSGFEYPAVLARYDVSEGDWERFTRDITAEVKLSPQQWRTVVGAGLGLLVIGGMMVGFFGAVPAYLAARKRRQHHEERNLVAAVAEGSASRLSSKITSWNESFFQPRGVVIRIDLPRGDRESLEAMDMTDLPQSSFDRFFQEGEYDARVKAAKRGRIVIIPLKRDRAPSVFSQSSTLAEMEASLPATAS